MQKPQWRRLVRALAVTSITVLGSLVLTAGPAHAYGTLTVRWALVDTDDCARLAGNLTVIAETDRCRLDDSADGTFFTKDPNSVAIKIELHDGSGMVAKEEFHPYGEKLWVYDTRNDSDEVHTWLWSNQWYGPYSPDGTSNALDYKVIDLNLTDGQPVELHIYDDSLATDFITSVGGGKA